MQKFNDMGILILESLSETSVIEALYPPSIFPMLPMSEWEPVNYFLSIIGGNGEHYLK